MAGFEVTTEVFCHVLLFHILPDDAVHDAPRNCVGILRRTGLSALPSCPPPLDDPN
jgi:hypothetical protein